MIEQVRLDFGEQQSNIDLLKEAVTKEMRNSTLSDAICAVQNVGYMAIKAKNQLAIKITLRTKGVLIEYKSKYDRYFTNYEIKHLDENISRIILRSFDDVLYLTSIFCIIAAKVLGDTGESFGCCGRFEQCSDAKKCIHPDKLYSLTCSYRKNLETNKIFYGKNKNI